MTRAVQKLAAKATRPDAIAMLSALQSPPAPTAETVEALRRSTGVRKPKPGARAGTRLVAGHFPEATLRALKHLMADEDTTLQALLDEAINDLLVKKGMSKLLNT